MTGKRDALMCAALVFVCAGIIVLPRWLWPTPPNSIVHLPADGKCPAGFARWVDLFSRDGKTYDGCVLMTALPGGHFTIDVLHPREAVMLPVPIELPRESAPVVRQ